MYLIWTLQLTHFEPIKQVEQKQISEQNQLSNHIQNVTFLHAVQEALEL